MNQYFKGKKFFTVSEKYKFFLWTPAKTGSNFHTKFFYENFEARIKTSGEKQDNFWDEKTFFNHHCLDTFEGHENYVLICSARNPFRRLLSAFSQGKRKDKSVPEFRKFFSEVFSESDTVFTTGMKDLLREPDYYIRLENLYDDLIKIPFVSESDLNFSGELEKKCLVKENSSNYRIDIRDYYTPDMIHFVYSTYYDYFNKLNYPPKP